MKQKKNSKPRKKASRHRSAQRTPPKRLSRRDRLKLASRERSRASLDLLCAKLGLGYRFCQFTAKRCYIEDAHSKTLYAVYDAARGVVDIDGNCKPLHRNRLAFALRKVAMCRSEQDRRKQQARTSSLARWKARLEASSLCRVVTVDLAEGDELCLRFNRRRDRELLLTFWPGTTPKIRRCDSTTVEMPSIHEVEEVIVAHLHYMQLPMVEIGSCVVVDYLDAGDTRKFRVVTQSHFRNRTIPQGCVVDSCPLGRAIVGMRCGDSAAVELGGKLQRIRVRVLE